MLHAARCAVSRAAGDAVTTIEHVADALNEVMAATEIASFKPVNMAAALQAGFVPKAAALCCHRTTMASGARLLTMSWVGQTQT